MQSAASMHIIITCRMDMMTMAGVVHIDRCRQLSPGYSCKLILTNAFHHILTSNRYRCFQLTVTYLSTFCACVNNYWSMKCFR